MSCACATPTITSTMTEIKSPKMLVAKPLKGSHENRGNPLVSATHYGGDDDDHDQPQR